MMSDGFAQFPADYSIADEAGAELVFTEAGGGEVRRSVSVHPRNASPWSARLRVAKPLVNHVSSGNYATPRMDTVLIVERGVTFLVDVAHPNEYQVVDVDGPVVQVWPLVNHELLLLITPWSITAIGRDGVEWSTPRLAIEGLRLDNVVDGWVWGVADPRDEEPREFGVELATGRTEGGSPAVN